MLAPNVEAHFWLWLHSSDAPDIVFCFLEVVRSSTHASHVSSTDQAKHWDSIAPQ